MRTSSHMVKKSRFDPGSKGGQILKEIDRIIKTEGGEELWLEWSPPQLIPRYNGFRLKRIDNGNRNNWKIILAIVGEPKYVARINNINEKGLWRIRQFLAANSIPEKISAKQKSQGLPPMLPPQSMLPTHSLSEGEKEMMEPEKQTDSLTEEFPEPLAQEISGEPPKEGKLKNPLRVNSESADLVLMAIEDIIKSEKIKPWAGWYKIKNLSKKILNALTDEQTNRTNARLTLLRLLKRMEKNGQIKMQRKGMARCVKIFLPHKSEENKTAIQQSAVSAGVPSGPAPIAKPKPTEQIPTLAINALKEMKFTELLRLKEEIRNDSELSSLLKFLLE